MIRYFTVAIVCFLLLGCESKDRIPKGTIPKTEMQKILWDIIQADAYSKQYIFKDSLHRKLNEESIKMYEQILELHNTDKENFLKSYQFYCSRPDLMKSMVDSLSAQGSRLQQDLYKPQATPPPKAIKPVN
jgi:hypothetical protein